MNKKEITKLNAGVFGIVAVLHFVRVLNGYTLQIGSWNAPMFLSVFAVIFLGWLAWENWKWALS